MQTKAWRYLFSELRCRGDVEAEQSHPMWNSFKRALSSSGLTEAALKLSICANFGHGSFLSDDKYLKRRECLEEYLQQQNPDFFQDLCEELGDTDVAAPGQEALRFHEVLDSAGIRRRGRFVARACSQYSLVVSGKV